MLILNLIEHPAISLCFYTLLHQVEKDKLILKIEAARSGKPWDEIDNTDNMPVIYSL